jgi:hypothetical protein
MPDTNSGVAQTPPPGIGLAYSTAMEKLAAQRKDLDTLDTKAGASIALLGAAIVAYISVAHGVGERVGAGVLLGLAVCTALSAYLTRKYVDAPDPETFATYAGYSPEMMQEAFLGAVLQAFTANQAKLRRKARGINMTFALVAVLAILIVAARIANVG